MKNARVYLVCFLSFLLLAISACGGSEGVVNSSAASNETAASSDNQTTGNDSEDMHHFDSPIGDGTGN